ncbi:MAG TPA: TetR family transcriptional regulator [Gemmatimonadaceae bacterium]|nr:TetR family transcriptional regulator [Gemmatimonadaceae bacterium]
MADSTHTQAGRGVAGRESEPGRAAQRRRTRTAIVAAAAELLARGRTPSVAEVAEVAEVSRRTVYMYFPTLEQLLIDAALHSITQATVDAAIDAVDAADDAEARVEALVRAIQRLSESTEQQGRTLLRLTVDRGHDDRSPDRPLRGYRRVEWIERALAPLRDRLDTARFERLVSALATVIGWEALIVARDVRGLSHAEAGEVSAWAARALVRAALEEAGSAPPRAARAPAAPRAARRR